MAENFNSSIVRVAAGTLVCCLVPFGVWAPTEEMRPAPSPAEGRSRVSVVWSHPPAEGSVAEPGSVSYPATAGSQAYRDPETGRFVAPPAGEAATAGPRRLSAALSTSAEGLVEEPVAASPGGVRVSLRGRFRSALVARTSSGGRVEIECDTGAGSGDPAATPGRQSGEVDGVTATDRPAPVSSPGIPGGAR